MIQTWIKKWIARIQNSTFIKSVLTLSAGVVVSQAIALLVTPVVSRLYTPEIMGESTIIVSNSAIIGTLLSIGLMTAIMLPEDDAEAKGLCRLMTKIIVIGSTLLYVLAMLIAGEWKLFSVSIGYGWACAMLWATVVLNNLVNICYGYVNRQKMYGVLFWNPTLGTASCAVIRILLGLMGCGLWGHMGGMLASEVIILIHMLRHANPFRGRIEHSSRSLLVKYKDFPCVLLPSDLVGKVSSELPTLLFDRFWGSFALGSYSMCMTILKLPTKFLAAPVNRVFYREATERVNRGENIGEFAFSLVKANTKIALIPIMMVVIWGRWLFAFVLGPEWADAGDYASIMSFYVLLAFCASCLSGKFVIIGQKKTILWINVVVLITNAIVFVVSHWLNFTAPVTIMLFSVVGGLVSLMDLTIFMKQTRVSLSRFFMFSFQYLLIPMVVGIVGNMVFRQLIPC